MTEKSSDKVIIRDARLCDRDEIQAIAFAVMREHGLVPDPEGLDSELGRFGSVDSSLVCQLVAELNTRIVGSIIISRSAGAMGKLTGFYLSPLARGKGIGRKLLQMAIQEAKASELSAIYLETLASMRAAIHLYDVHGWQRGPDLPYSSGAERSYLLNISTSA